MNKLTGKVVQVLDITTGMGKKGQWKKQEFILETQTQYPKKIAVTIFGEKVDQFRVQEGETVTVDVDLESREYNGRWYTDVQAWRLSRGDQGVASDYPSTPPPSQSNNSAYASNNSGDDLPF